MQELSPGSLRARLRLGVATKNKAARVRSPLVSLSQLPGAGSKPMAPFLSYSATSSVRSRAEDSWRGAVPLASLAWGSDPWASSRRATCRQGARGGPRGAGEFSRGESVEEHVVRPVGQQQAGDLQARKVPGGQGGGGRGAVRGRGGAGGRGGSRGRDAGYRCASVEG